MSLLERLQYMKQNGVNMNAIAKLAGCAQQTLSNWLNGRQEISIHLQRSLEYAIEEFVKKMEKCVKTEEK